MKPGKTFRPILSMQTNYWLPLAENLLKGLATRMIQNGLREFQTRDSIYQNQPETEQNDPNTQQNEPETKQPEPVVQQQETEKVCTACGKAGGGNCPDCGAVMGDEHTRKHSMKRIRLKLRKMIRRKWKALNIRTRRTLATIRITIAVMKLVKRQLM